MGSAAIHRDGGRGAAKGDGVGCRSQSHSGGLTRAEDDAVDVDIAGCDRRIAVIQRGRPDVDLVSGGDGGVGGGSCSCRDGAPECTRAPGAGGVAKACRGPVRIPIIHGCGSNGCGEQRGDGAGECVGEKTVLLIGFHAIDGFGFDGTIPTGKNYYAYTTNIQMRFLEGGESIRRRFNANEGRSFAAIRMQARLTMTSHGAISGRSDFRKSRSLVDYHILW